MKWISVEDELPVEAGQVLIVFLEPFFGELTQEINTGYYDEESKKFRFWLPDRQVAGGVTHWAKLPEPPTK